VLFCEGLLVLVAGPVFHTTRVFAREKAGRTAPLLLLTGADPRAVLSAKVRSVYRALRFAFLPVGATGIVLFLALFGAREGRDRWFVLVFLLGAEAVLFGSALGALLGLVAGLVSRSPTHAWLGLLSAAPSCFLLGPVLAVMGVMASLICPPVALVPFLGAVMALWLATDRERWSPWRLGILLALNVLTVGVCFLLSSWAYRWFTYTMGASSSLCWILFALVGVNATVAASAFLWWRLGLRVFEAGLVRESAMPQWQTVVLGRSESSRRS